MKKIIKDLLKSVLKGILYLIFLFADKNNDGKLSKAEISGLLLLINVKVNEFQDAVKKK